MTTGTPHSEDQLSPRSRLDVNERDRITDEATYSNKQFPFTSRPFQALAVFFWGLMLPLSVCIFFLMCSLPPLWPLVIPYLIWIQFDPAPESGGRTLGWMRRLIIWRWYAEYFPIKITKVRALLTDRRSAADR